MRGHPVQEVAVVAHDHGAPRVTVDGLFQSSERVNVEVVGRLVEEQQVSSLRKDKGKGKGKGDEKKVEKGKQSDILVKYDVGV